MEVERPRTPELPIGFSGLPPSTDDFDFKYSASNGLLDLDDFPDLCFDETPAVTSDTIVTPGFFPLDTGFYPGHSLHESPSKSGKQDEAREAQFTAGLPISGGLTGAPDPERIETTTPLGTNRILWGVDRIFSDLPEIYLETQKKARESDPVLDKNRIEYSFSNKSSFRKDLGGHRPPVIIKGSPAAICRLQSLLSTAPSDDAADHRDGKNESTSDVRGELDRESDAVKGVQVSIVTTMSPALQDITRRGIVETLTRPVVSVGRVIDAAKMNKTLARIFPYDTIQRLQENPRKCVACTGASLDTRCKNPVRWTDDAVEQIAVEAAKLQAPHTIGSTASLLYELIGAATCTYGKHRMIAKSQLEELQRASGVRNGGTGSRWRSTKRMSSSDLEAVPDWLAGLVEPFTVSAVDRVVELQSATTASVLVVTEEAQGLADDQTPLATHTVTTSRTTLIEQSVAEVEISPKPEHASAVESAHKKPSTQLSVFTSATIGQSFTRRPYPSWGRNLTTQQAIRDQLLLELTPQEQGPGFIYMYWNPPNFKHVKIGVTQAGISKRLGEWRRQCGHEAQSHEVLGEGEEGENDDGVTAALQMPHVYRVEHLVHTELRECRLIEQQCEGCGRSHHEWFEVDVGHARAVVRKWAQWMKMRRPFEVPDDESADDNSAVTLSTATATATATEVTVTVTATTIKTNPLNPASKGKAKDKAKKTPRREARRIPFSTADADALYLPGRLTRDEVQEICEPLVPETRPAVPVDRSSRRRSVVRHQSSPRVRARKPTPLRTRGRVDLGFRVEGKEKKEEEDGVECVKEEDEAEEEEEGEGGVQVVVKVEVEEQSVTVGDVAAVCV